MASGKDQALAAALDATGGLSRVREDDQGSVVWQVAPLDRDMGGLTVDAAARLHIATTDGKVTALDSGPGTNLRLNLAAGSDGRRLVLAEQSSGRWRATLDGERLKPVPPSESGDWCQVFELPAWSGKLHVWYTPSWGFALVQVAVLGLAVLLALPIRRAPAAREES
ncbi:MAG: hypothetical protein LBJ02_01915 [Bifidobacteriaceae bacterium]|nr:hypothetical protein [Bifidobacteriaceae bacterium]